MTQKQVILKHLKTYNPDTGRRHTITPLEALGMFGIYRLAARIKELKEDGYNIVTHLKTDATGKRYAKYELVTR